ncbi:hypothetical protein SAMN05421595_0488 [Austwickia chelonae]|uniref:Uncharacterized protein n=1 Tax=Austwickia chelonae NBRC 105200 TaxID=1184607 RepID=K6UMB9_9MICO|nr:hypothetical protein [Austwickia chelonae]GAB77976.1 hypothetical protein AUCHE_08_02190 [Austwickia chelonae NBRC 105200]SEV93471.1 hypothetical protein SAMN05421595_0488 [Austwickia chelonae]
MSAARADVDESRSARPSSRGTGGATFVYGTHDGPVTTWSEGLRGRRRAGDPSSSQLVDVELLVDEELGVELPDEPEPPDDDVEVDVEEAAVELEDEPRESVR